MDQIPTARFDDCSEVLKRYLTQLDKATIQAAMNLKRETGGKKTSPLYKNLQSIRDDVDYEEIGPDSFKEDIFQYEEYEGFKKNAPYFSLALEPAVFHLLVNNEHRVCETITLPIRGNLVSSLYTKSTESFVLSYTRVDASGKPVYYADVILLDCRETIRGISFKFQNSGPKEIINAKPTPKIQYVKKSGFFKDYPREQLSKVAELFDFRS